MIPVKSMQALLGDISILLKISPLEVSVLAMVMLLNVQLKIMEIINVNADTTHVVNSVILAAQCLTRKDGHQESLYLEMIARDVNASDMPMNVILILRLSLSERASTQPENILVVEFALTAEIKQRVSIVNSALMATTDQPECPDLREILVGSVSAIAQGVKELEAVIQIVSLLIRDLRLEIASVKLDLLDQTVINVHVVTEAIQTANLAHVA